MKKYQVKYKSPPTRSSYALTYVRASSQAQAREQVKARFANQGVSIISVVEQ